MSINTISTNGNPTVQTSAGSNIDSQITQLTAQAKDIQKQLTAAQNDKTLSAKMKEAKVELLTSSLEAIDSEIVSLKASKARPTSKTNNNTKIANNKNTESEKSETSKSLVPGTGLVVDKNA